MPLNNRNPGSLPNAYAATEMARSLLAKQNLDPDVKAVIQALLTFSFTQAEINKRLWESRKGLPEPHSETHLGGPGSTDDSLAGNQLPESIDVGDAGEIGDAILGFAPINHQHAADGLDELLAFAFLGHY